LAFIIPKVFLLQYIAGKRAAAILALRDAAELNKSSLISSYHSAFRIYKVKVKRIKIKKVLKKV